MRGISALVLALQLARADNADLAAGRAAYRAGQYSVALEKLQRAEKEPGSGLAAVYLGLTEAALGKCSEALPRLTDSKYVSDVNTDKLRGIAAAKCYAAMSQSEKAFALADQLQKRYPDDADVLYVAAKLYMKAFNDATFAMFQRTPDSYRVHELSAEIFEVQNRYAEAAGEYRKALELNSAAPDLHFRLGRALLLESHEAKSLDEAAVQFREELKISPEDAACEFQLGQIAQAKGKGAEARPHFERALELSPNFVQALIALGKLDTTEKRYDGAIRELRRATGLEPKNETAHYALMTAYRDAGDMEQAQAEKARLDELQKPPAGEFSDFLKRLDAPPAKP